MLPDLISRHGWYYHEEHPHVPRGQLADCSRHCWFLDQLSWCKRHGVLLDLHALRHDSGVRFQGLDSFEPLGDHLRHLLCRISFGNSGKSDAVFKPWIWIYVPVWRFEFGRSWKDLKRCLVWHGFGLFGLRDR